VGKRDERTQKDEDNYNANLRREEPIKTEVIVELREQNRNLLANQVWLLRALLSAESVLAIFRAQVLEQTEALLASNSKCIPGCLLHEWHDADGWHRQGEGK
jgi:hypothetical protein